MVAYAAITGKTVNVADPYVAQGFDFSGPLQFDARTGYRLQSFLTVPMQNHEGEVLGILQLINALEPGSGQVVPFSPADQRLAESLASHAAVALSNRQLIMLQPERPYRCRPVGGFRHVRGFSALCRGIFEVADRLLK